MSPEPDVFYARLDFWALIVGLGALGISLYSVYTAKMIARRTQVIELHNAWLGVNRIDPDQLIGPDVKKAVDVLELTAILWAHQVVDRDIIYQKHRFGFFELYDTLSSIDKVVPGYQMTAAECISPQVQTVYKQMKRW